MTEDRFNPFGLVILLAAIAACFGSIQEALDEQGMALYLPSFGGHPDDGSDAYWASVAAPPVASAPAAPLPAAAAPPPAAAPLPAAAAPPPAAAPLPLPPAAVAPPVSGRGKLPPPPMGQGGPAAPAAPPAPAPAAPAETWHISRANLELLLKASGGMGADGCLNTPVIMEGMQGISQVVADMEWAPGQKLVFSIDPSIGAITCLEFAFNREAPQW